LVLIHLMGKGILCPQRTEQCFQILVMQNKDDNPLARCL
jgi:hypothetical protein